MSAITRAHGNPHLAGVIASPRGGHLGKDEFRRYRSVFETETVIARTADNFVRQISYEVGRRHDSVKLALAPPPTDVPRTTASYPTAPVLCEDFIGFAKKHSNFSASFEYSSLAGLVERIAVGLAAWPTYPGGVSSEQLIGDAPVLISSLGTHSTPINVTTSSVFIPRLVDRVLSPDVFAVLIAACASTRVSVVTDILALDETNCPIVPSVDAAAFPDAAVGALRILGTNMVASDQGPLFSLALTRGIHQVCSVVGHTDEGGILRDILRSGAFTPSFGGIHFGLDEYTGLPALSTSLSASVSAYVDTIALTSAALVAHCDPGVTYDGHFYPTVLTGTTGTDNISEPGGTLEGTDPMAQRNRSQLLDTLPSFSDLYVKGLGILFGAGGTCDVAVRVFSACARSLPVNPRHLRHPTVAPFFWIEPTSLLDRIIVDSPAEHGGCGSLVNRNSVADHPAFEAYEEVGRVGSMRTEAIVQLRGARFMPFLFHWLGNPANGLGAIAVKQLDPAQVIHPGPHDTLPLVRDRVMANVDLGGFLWTRGQSPIPAPAEFLNLGGSIGLHFKHATIDDDGDVAEEHLPRYDEMLGLTVKCYVSQPVGIAVGKSNAPSSHARRARTRASNALAQARKRSKFGFDAEVRAMATSLSAPSFKKAPLTNPEPTHTGGQGAGRLGTDVHVPNDGDPLEGIAQATPVRHYDSQNAPRIQGAGIEGVGGRAGNPAPTHYTTREQTPPLADPNDTIEPALVTNEPQPQRGLGKQ